MITILLCVSLSACKNYTPAPEYQVQGTYFGKDSIIVCYDKYGKKMFGNCIRVRKERDGSIYFFDKVLKPTANNFYVFDYTLVEDYGIANHQDLHAIRYVGQFDFKGNKLCVDYSVGKSGSPMSQFHFEGWR